MSIITKSHRERFELAIIIPAFNESQTIKETIQEFHNVVEYAFFVIVDNNSCDDTASKASRTLTESGALGCVVTESRQGKGWALRTGFSSVDADIYVICDADCTYPAAAIEELLAPIKLGHADMVIGNRHTSGDYGRETNRSLNHLGNLVVPKIINFLFSAKIGDIFSGYRAFSREFIYNFPILSTGFEIETEMSLHALDKRFRVMEISIGYKKRPPGSVSKLSAVRDGMRVLLLIFKILGYYKPLYLFGALAAIFSAAGGIIGLIPIHQYVTTGFIPSIPSAILAAGMEVISLMFLSIGLVSDAVARHHRFDFELSLNSWRRETRKFSRF